MIEYVFKLLLIVARAVLVYIWPLFKTVKLQAAPESNANEKMLVYWIIMVFLSLLEKVLFFLNE